MSHPIPGYEYHCEFCFVMLDEGKHVCKEEEE